MKHTDTVIIGGGQAGLAMSRCLMDRGIEHVALERGRVAERWRSERWNSLRLLTPRWQSRLPGWSYQGPDEHGYMTMPEVIDYLERYARSFSAPVQTGVTVTSIERDRDEFRVRTDAGEWTAANVVIATGHSDRPYVPPIAASLAPDIQQIVPSSYRHPGQLRDGGVLVVGASATGVQLASEIARSGRRVTLAVGRHTRVPRVYRGRDILAWLDATGILTETTGGVHDIEASRSQPSLQLIGSNEHRSIDLGTLREEGVRIVGRLLGASMRRVYLADDLRGSIARAEVKMHEQLDRVDRYIARMRLDDAFPAGDRPARIAASSTPAMMSLAAEGIRTVIWATGYRRAYPWLRVPVLDSRGEIEHAGGITAVPGLYVLGLYFMRRRNSSLLDGVGADAAELADHIVHRLARGRLAAA